MRHNTSILLTILATLAALASGPSALAQSEAYPSRRIQLVVPFAVGNGIDQLAREYAEVLRTQMNTNIVVENREGAGGLIGGAMVARAPADGYTVMIAAHPPFAIAPQVQKEPPYDPVAGFMPVARLGSVPLILVTASASPFKTWQEMSTYFRANPDKANYAASGVGSPGQLFTVLIKLATNLPLQEISYKSTAQAMTDVLAGQVQVSLVSVPAAAQHIKAGTLRPLAIGSKERLKLYPELPTLAELIGQPGFEASVWYGILAPVGTPADRVERLYAEFAKASAAPRIADFMNRVSITPQLQGPAAFAASIRNDAAVARRMIEVARIKPE